MQAIHTMNKYTMVELLKSDIPINYDCFYKSDVEQMLECLRAEYRKLLKEFEKINEQNKV